MQRILASDKLKVVKEVTEQGKTLKEVSQRYNCTRQSLYLWVKIFKKNPQKARTNLQNNYKKGKYHPKSLSWKVERQILDLVVKHPNLSIRALEKQLARLGHKISAHGVYNVLLRYELQTKELRHRFSQEHPVKTVFAHALSPAYRAKIVEEYLEQGKNIAQVCKLWKVSRPTFYDWLGRYRQAQASQINVVEALAKKHAKGAAHPRSLRQEVKEAILGIIRENPALSVHKIYAQVPQVAGRPIAGHHGIQNLLQRENLNTFAKRLTFAQGFVPEPKVQVAPLYEMPPLPRLSAWRLLFAPFATVPKWVIRRPLTWPIVFPALAFLLYIFEVNRLARPQMFFPLVALTFGLVFFLYSLKYYISLVIVMIVTQRAGETESSKQQT